MIDDQEWQTASAIERDHPYWVVMRGCYPYGSHPLELGC
jgi:hypothetical protein